MSGEDSLPGLYHLFTVPSHDRKSKGALCWLLWRHGSYPWQLWLYDIISQSPHLFHHHIRDFDTVYEFWVRHNWSIIVIRVFYWSLGRHVNYLQLPSDSVLSEFRTRTLTQKGKAGLIRTLSTRFLQKGFQVGKLSFLLFSCWVMSDFLRPHGLQHARPSCLSLSPAVCPRSCPWQGQVRTTQ